MTCPKCNAKVGIMQEIFPYHNGVAAGILCYMCGYWFQERYSHPSPKRGVTGVMTVPVGSALGAGSADSAPQEA